jgi:hypothetical protein
MLGFAQFVREEIGDPLNSDHMTHHLPHSPYGDHSNPRGLLKLFAATRAKATARRSEPENVPLHRIRATNKYIGKKRGKYDAFPDHEEPVLAKVLGTYHILDGHHRIHRAVEKRAKSVRAHVYHVKKHEVE